MYLTLSIFVHNLLLMFWISTKSWRHVPSVHKVLKTCSIGPQSLEDMVHRPTKSWRHVPSAHKVLKTCSISVYSDVCLLGSTFQQEWKSWSLLLYYTFGSYQLKSFDKHDPSSLSSFCSIEASSLIFRK